MEGWHPASNPPGPLPNNQGLIGVGEGGGRSQGLAQQRSPCFHQLLLRRKGSALCPSKFETIWTEGGSPMFTEFWTFFLSPGRRWERMLLQPVWN